MDRSTALFKVLQGPDLSRPNDLEEFFTAVNTLRRDQILAALKDKGDNHPYRPIIGYECELCYKKYCSVKCLGIMKEKGDENERNG